MNAYLKETAIVQEWNVANEHAGVRADRYLSTKIGRLSRTKAKRIILAGDFRREGKSLKPAQMLRPGEIVHLWRMPPKEAELDISSVGIIFEDEDWLVVDKPPDLVVHPTANNLHHTLTGWLKHYAPDIPIHPCHRLDRETSGLLVCAKNRVAESTLKTAFQQAIVKKSYLAVVRGELRDSILIDAPLGLQGDLGLVKIRMVVDRHAGLPSRTFVAPIFYDEHLNRTLLKCEPLTGRQHQIRAHLAHIGHPIVGDKLYAMGDEFFDAFTRRALGERFHELEHDRHALHAHSIKFFAKGQEMAFTSPFPEDLKLLFGPPHCSTKVVS